MKWFPRSFAFIFCALAAAGCRHGTPEHRAEFVVSKMARVLGLSPEQKAKLEDLKAAILSVRTEGEGDRKQAIAEIRSAILSDRLDAGRAKAAIEKHQDLRRKRMESEFEAVFPKLAEFHASLTIEQKNKAVAWIDELVQRFTKD